MATINLGNIKFNWKGTYNAGTTYAIDDVVAYNGSSYVCIQATTGNLPTVTAYWDTMSSAGTNGTNGSDGTDLSTTLTTQGDIVYRDGSGLQRLGAGTSGQVLQTGGSGANPSWGTVSSDWVKLASTTVSSSVASVSFDGYFTSDYNVYKIFISDWVDANNDWKKVNFRFGNSQYTSSNYDWTGHYSYRNSGNNNSGTALEGGRDSNYIPLTWWGVGTGHNCDIEITIQNPLSTTKTKQLKWLSGSHDNGSTLHYFVGYGSCLLYTSPSPRDS